MTLKTISEASEGRPQDFKQAYLNKAQGNLQLPCVFAQLPSSQDQWYSLAVENVTSGELWEPVY